jgi:hypothetical protein
MGPRRSLGDIGLRITTALVACFVAAGAAPNAGPGVVAQPSACHSRNDCGPKIIGGLLITFTGWSCTTGFVARDTSTGALVLLTAGHCVAGSGPSAMWSHHGVAVGRASVDAFRPNSNADVGAIDLIDPRPGPEVYGASAVDIRPVTGIASNVSQTPGSRVCRSAATSGWRCGSVVAADVDATVDGTPLHHTWWIDFPSAAGDSGAPVLDSDGRAAGTLIATTPSRSLYSTVDWITAELGVRVCVNATCE